MIQKYFCLISLFLSTTLFAQKADYNSLIIADSLKENANAVVRLNQIDITIASQRSMKISTKRIVTVLDEKGLSAIDAGEYYDKKTSVNSILATVYNAFGVEIKKIRRKDFRDQCVIDGITIFSDSRTIYLNYVPVGYPFTIVYESEVQTSNTATIPDWKPISDYLVSVEKSILNVNYPEDLGFKYKEYNFSNFKIKKEIDTKTQLSYVATNSIAQKREDYSPNDIYPKVMFGLEYFNLEGVDGNAKTWLEFGKWYKNNILEGTTELSNETKSKIIALVGNETDLEKKAKIIYKFVQEKSRYVSIQVGIGGFKPMLAKDVDRLGYGDCKALTNYTKALLDAVNVPSYNTILFGDLTKRSINPDFVSIQGNHMMLCIPNKEKNIFLECTSQTDPFGFQANFTDDRNVLIIKPEGGEIVKTTIYDDKSNFQISKGKYNLDNNGSFSGTITIVSGGSQYAQKSHLETVLPTEKEAHYKQYWDNIGNLKINKSSFINDKDKISFTEKLEIFAENYGKVSGNNLIFNINAFNVSDGNVKRIRNRKTPFEIQRGFCDTDEIEINMPTALKIEFIPSNFDLSSKFGDYKTEIIKKDNTNLVYKRTFFLKKGLYTSKEYEEYRLFMEQIAKNDNTKIILNKI
jgi:Domain of Unknown Function with PDB structure (DUF3857)/Domain of Unknown Function with PDB structure (DUF3858)